MKFIEAVTAVIVAIAWFSVASNAAVVEDGLGDGVYADYGKRQNTNDKASNSLQRRREGLWAKPGKPWEDYSVPLPISNHKCIDDHGELNMSDYHRAVANLKTFCQDFDVSPRGLYVSVAGQAMAYVCSFKGLTNCHRHEWDEAERVLDDACGLRMGGWVKMKKWGKKYGRGHVGMRICDKVNDGSGKHYAIDPMPVWVNGTMYEAWKTGSRGDGIGGE